MQTRHFLPFVLLAILLLSSCKTPKDISYFQDLQPDVKSLSIGPSTNIRIRPKDQISILVNTPDLKHTNLLTLPQASQPIGMQSSTAATNGNGNLSLAGMPKGTYIYCVREAGKKVLDGKCLVK